MGIQALIFDVDGTVAETADLHRAAFNRAFQEHGLGWHWDRAIYSQLAPVAFSLAKLRLFAMAARQSGQSQTPSHAEMARICARKSRIYCNLMREGRARLRPGVARLMKEAQHEGLLLGAVSTSTRAETQALLTATLGFHGMGWFSALRTAENASLHKGERSLYRAVLDDFGLQGQRAIAIEDSVSGASGAAACGLGVVVAPSMYTASAHFPMAALTISDLGQPAEPFTLINGEANGATFISPAMLGGLLRPKAAAA
jgi:HAD superfamily hydrolase (TIGR01509 family)